MTEQLKRETRTPVYPVFIWGAVGFAIGWLLFGLLGRPAIIVSTREEIGIASTTKVDNLDIAGTTHAHGLVTFSGGVTGLPGVLCGSGSAVSSVSTTGSGTCDVFFNTAGDHLSSSGSTVSLAPVASGSFLGRVSAGPGNVETLTGTQATTLLDTFTSLLKGLVPASGGGTTTFLRADGNWATPAGTGVSSVSAGTSISVTGTASVPIVNLNFPTTACTAGQAVTSSSSAGAPSCSTFFNTAGDHLSSSGSTVSLAQINTGSFLGRITSGTGNVETLTGTQATSLLDVFTSTLKGLVPASGGGTTNFLRADGTFATPPGTGVPTTRNINTTAPLTGGGTLAADLTLAVNTFTSLASGVVPASGGGTANFLRADGTWQTPAGTGVSSVVAGQSITVTGTTTATVALNFPTTACSAGQAVTSHNSAGTPSCSTFFNTAGDHLSSSGSTVSLAQIATASFLGRTTAGTGNVETLTGTQATTLLDLFTSTLKGLVPASGGGTSTFLRADGNWATPTGTSFGNHSTGLDNTCAFDGVTTPVCGATLSGSTYTLTRDIWPNVMTISNNVIVKNVNFRIVVMTTLTGTGTASINCDGGNASGGTAGTVAAAGFYGASIAGQAGVSNGSTVGGAATSGTIPNFPANSTNSTSNAGASGNVGGSIGQVPHKGGGGGGSASNTPGSGGTVTLVTGTATNGGFGIEELYRGRNTGTGTLISGGSGGGGASSTGTTGGTGGGGGGGGCTVYIEAGELDGSLAISANGGNGGNGTTGGTGTAGGGGGGGGGTVGIVAGINNTTSLTQTVTGGTHGSGAGGGGNGGDGAAGTKFLSVGR